MNFLQFIVLLFICDTSQSLKPFTRRDMRGGLGAGGNNGKGPSDFGLNSSPSGKSGNSINVFLAELIKAYSNQLLKRPYVTKIISSAVVGGTGDFLIQMLSCKELSKVDIRRWLVFTSVSGLYIAPAIHLWFNWLGFLPIPSTVGKVGTALIQMVLDQTIGAVIVNLGFFYAFELAQSVFPPYTGNRNFLFAGTKSVKANMWATLVANWTCWPGNINFILL